jgi:U4/U6.U5 tri-snRNP component SNU23
VGLLFAETKAPPPGTMSAGGRGAGDKALGVDQTARRTWDKETFAKKEEQREQDERDVEEEADRRRANRQVVARENLKLTGNRAEGRMDLAKHVGKTMVVEGADGDKSKQGGWYCETCDCVLRDSMAWLDHINGKKHQRALGMNMRVERSTLPQVQAKLAAHSGKLLAQNDAKGKSSAQIKEDLDRRIQNQIDQEEEQAKARKNSRSAKRQEAAAKKAAAAASAAEDDGMDAETRAMAEAMGLPMGFG